MGSICPQQSNRGKEGSGAGLVKLINLWMERKGWPGQPGPGPGGSKGQVLSPCWRKKCKLKANRSEKLTPVNLMAKLPVTTLHFIKISLHFIKISLPWFAPMVVKSQVYCSFWWMFKLMQFIVFIVFIKIKPIKRRYFGEKKS